MGGVLVGFAIIGAVIFAGYLLGRIRLLGDHGRVVLNRLGFFVLSPCLLFTVLADADVHVLFSKLLLASAVAALVAFALSAAVAFWLWRRPAADALIGVAASGWVNSNNIGIPVAVYVIGNPAVVAPVILLQLVFFTPIFLIALDLLTGGGVSLKRVLLQPVRNPVILASVAGALLAATNTHLPAAVMEPFRLIGAAAVPVVLIAFGLALHGEKILARGTARADTLLASGVKLILMPIAAWLAGHYLFDLGREQLFAVTAIAALPTAQNVFNYAQRYQRGEILARDTVFITTVGAIPVLLVVAALLGQKGS